MHLQLTKSGISSQVKRAVSPVTTDGHSNLPGGPTELLNETYGWVIALRTVAHFTVRIHRPFAHAQLFEIVWTEELHFKHCLPSSEWVGLRIAMCDIWAPSTCAVHLTHTGKYWRLFTHIRAQKERHRTCLRIKSIRLYIKNSVVAEAC